MRKQMESKSYYPTGELHHNYVLTNEEVADIVDLLETTSITQAGIAEMYGVGRSLIGNILHGRRRTSITGGPVERSYLNKIKEN